MRKLLCLLLCLTVLLPLLPLAAAEPAPALTIAALAETIRPGKAFPLTFTVSEAAACKLSLRTQDGTETMIILDDYPAQAGVNQIWWNGTSGGASAPEGVYQLVLACGGQETSAVVVIGSHAPYITGITADKDAQTMTMTVEFYASVDGLLTVGLWADNAWAMVENRSVTAGTNTVLWDASKITEGTTALTLTLTDATQYSSNEEHVAVCPADFGISFATPTPEPTEVPTATPAPEAPANETAAPEVPAAPVITAEPVITEDPAPRAEAAGEIATPAPTVETIVVPEVIVEAVELTEAPTAVPTPDIVFTPSYGSPYEAAADEPVSYWNTEMDVTDEAAMWAMLSSPITVIDASYKGQTKICAEPDEDSRTVGVVTGQSQGVRVIEHLDNGWSLIECYSSTFHDNSIDAWNMLIQGYVPTSELVTKEINKKYHIIVDKLTQRLYLFSEEGLKATLLVSTGLANAEQPYNETRSGEFLYISPTGGFWSDNMFCPRAMKFNDGDLLHEVPYVQRHEGGEKIYSATEPYLGQRASHGCIRVQRRKTPEGINMQWIWDNRKELGRIVIWEDWQGRQVSYPSDDTVLYYNAKGGSYYHREEKCASAKSSVVFSPFTYAELDTGEFADLDFCPYCAPALRKAEIDEINQAHAFGGDHDPVLTKARQKYLEALLEDISFEELTEGEKRYYTPSSDE